MSYRHRPVLVLAVCLLASLSWLGLLVAWAPQPGQEQQEQQRQALKFPSSLEDLHHLSELLHAYEENAYGYVLTLFTSAYLFKQTFAVPGSVFMNILAGAVFGIYLGFPLCCLLTATGATCCFLLARYCGRSVALQYFPHRVAFFEKRLSENEHRLAYFLLFLRFFPMSPNWAINMCCGVLGVPTGVLLTQITSMSDIFSWSTLAQLTCIAVIALIPGIIQKGKRKKSLQGSLTLPDNIDAIVQ